MKEGRSKKWGAARWAAVLIVGTLVGSTLIGPAVAHLNRPLTFAHLKKHFYTKKVANNRFINVGEKASDADKLDGKDSAEFLGAAGKAADADKLDNLDSAAFQKSGCVNGNVLGYARIADEDYGTSYADVPGSFTCVSGFTVRAKETAAGEFTIDFGFNGIAVLSPCGEHIPVATLEDSAGEIIASSGSESSGGPLLGQDCVVLVKTFPSNGVSPVTGKNFNLVVNRSA